MSLIEEYEVFSNDNDAIAFFFYRNATLDGMPDNGPYFFTVEGDKLHAGTKTVFVTFPEVDEEVIETAKERGVIMLTEFEGQDPVRVTPCYFVESFQ